MCGRKTDFMSRGGRTGNFHQIIKRYRRTWRVNRRQAFKAPGGEKPKLNRKIRSEAINDQHFCFHIFTESQFQMTRLGEGGGQKQEECHKTLQSLGDDFKNI